MKRRVVCLFISILLTGCSLNEINTAPQIAATLPNPSVKTAPPPKPEGAANSFLTAWKARDYAGMYGLLTPLSQDAIKKDTFPKSYSNAAAALTLSSLETTILSSLQKD